jgi:hypothetical protein
VSFFTITKQLFDLLCDNDGDLLAACAGKTINLYFLDAQYEPAQLGTVFLIGKVRCSSGYESACIAVSNIKQTLFFVPKPFVFQDTDGDLAKCALPAVVSVPVIWSDTVKMLCDRRVFGGAGDCSLFFGATLILGCEIRFKQSSIQGTSGTAHYMAI